MKGQTNFTDIEYSQRKRKTKREEFLECMDAITPWDEVVAMIEPYYYHNQRGRKARGIETMFRIFAPDLVQPFRRSVGRRDL